MTAPDIPAPTNYTRHWALILLVVAIASPAPLLRLAHMTGAWDPHLEPLVESLIFGVGIFAAATLLTWASEVAETEMSAGLALVILALIAVLPEYAVDLYFAWSAPHVAECVGTLPTDLFGDAIPFPPGCEDPHPSHLAVANMTGGNRLLVGLAWPAIFFIFYWRHRVKEMPVLRSNAMGILFLGAATLYSFSIPLRGELSLIDTGVMFGLFGAYMYLASRFPPELEREFVGPALALASLGKTQRRAAIALIFAFAAAVIFAAAEPFAEGLVETGKNAGIDEFVLVQWVAPLASESPEFILAAMLAARGRHDAGMTVLISSKVNQWTLLIGSLPLAYSISGGEVAALDFDSRQAEEVFLTAGQSLFAVAIFLSLSMVWWEAVILGALFGTQFFFTDTSVRLAYGAGYCVLAGFVLIRDIPHFGNFLSAARETALEPHLIHDRNVNDRAPPKKE